MLKINRRNLFAGGVALSTISADAQAFAAKTNPNFPSLALRPTLYHADECWTLSERMAHYAVPGAVIAILRRGQIDAVHGFGTRVAGRSLSVNEDTLFSVGSISKVVTAALCLKLVESGVVDLNKDVSRWLRRWRIPAGPSGDKSAITLRMLLSHTAGFSLHGFADYDPGAPLPTIVETLEGAPPALNETLKRIDPAGTRSRYSGGGYVVIQGIIEDAVGETLDALAQQLLFAPLGMKRSRFAAALADDTENVAHAHDGKGRPVALPRGWQSFAELAPSGLWTTAGDLARFVIMLGASYRTSDGFLPQKLAIEMMTPISPGFYGLGPRLAGEGDAFMFHHGGSNESYQAYLEGNLVTGDGLIVLTNGANGAELGDEVRNAVSDALAWPGDWSVKLSQVPLDHVFTDFAGRYRRRADCSPNISGFLDTGYDADFVEIAMGPAGLKLIADSRTARDLVPVNTNSFVNPGGYIPASKHVFRFERNANGSVRQLRIEGGQGVLLFDRL